MVSIVIADDHQVVRQGLRKLLEAEPDITVVGEAGDGITALGLVEKLKPDVLVVDFKMPGLNGSEVAQQTAQRFPKTRVVVLSMYSDESYVLEALRAGAKSYVLKESTSEELVTAVRKAAEGQSYLSAILTDRAIEVYKQKAKTGVLDPYDSLSRREKEVLGLVAQGLTNADISARLFISQRTVEVHRAAAMRKLKLKRHADLIHYALRRGLITEPGTPLAPALSNNHRQSDDSD